ncbi:siderophore-interacting protein [Nonomuraea cavernae]|uniref:Siderophore-interacting protein n=1 Tax=Nonomuraea cavernae TaxID=2045107 RepID=A0A917Z355_9ACTN|nr:siderophore-interacting protein [Nonomuraea cavernae]MCA2186641.1 siderophore-interacting protein [Nonomuraea cavernae]GGO71699.1 siderophore-interacting protein [Nonomuraea cavernae]
MTDKPRDHHLGVVLRTERLTPHMIRVVLGGDGLRDFATRGLTDHYVKLVFPHEGVDYPTPFSVKQVRETMPREVWPRLRTYTVRAWDPETLELTIDFVHHGDKGLAGPWAAGAVPGDAIMMLGPGGDYAPDPQAAWHLLVGDESALPAIAASVEALPEGVPAHVFVEVDGPRDELKLGASADVQISWLYRNDRPLGDALVEAVSALAFPGGDVHAFVHGEAGFVKRLRRHLRVERGVPMERLSISGYWRAGVDDEAWRAVKKDWNRQVEAEEAAALG